MSNYVIIRDGGKSSEEGLMKPWLQLFSAGIPISGTPTSLKASQRAGGANMSVDIAIGNCFASLASLAYGYWGYTDAVNNVTVTSSDPTNPRLDVVVAYIDLSVVSSASNNNPGALKFISIAGTAAASPVVPTDAAIQIAVGAANPFVKIATLTVGALVSTIVNANIADLRSDIAYKGQLSTGNGWNNFNQVPTSVTALGNGSYNIQINGTDLTTVASERMRIRAQRAVAAPTQCTSLNGTTQFFNRSTTINGMTFTNNFTISVWIKLSSYGTSSSIVSRYNGTSGFQLGLEANGAVTLWGYNGSASNYSIVRAIQSVPLNRWVHITAQLDMATFTATPTTSYIMMGGVDIPAFVLRSGTNPTALIQAGNLEIGSINAGALPFPGKIAQAAIYSAKVTQATVLASMNQTLAGTETNLVSAYSFNNAITDLNVTNANNLTANGSAVATNADTPFQGGGFDYGIIMAKSYSTNTIFTVQVPEGYTLPTSGGITALYWSSAAEPYLFPSQRSKHRILSLYSVNGTTTTPTAGTWYNPNPQQLNTPIGDWNIGYAQTLFTTRASASSCVVAGTLSANSATEDDNSMTADVRGDPLVAIAGITTRTKMVSLAAATIYYHLVKTPNISMNNIYQLNDISSGMIWADNAYL